MSEAQAQPTTLPSRTNLLEYEGDLLKTELDAIMHQCNCMSKGVSGLADYIFTEVPEANTYKDLNPDPNQFGTYKKFSNPNGPYKNVVNIYSQVYPGHANDCNDTSTARLQAFFNAATAFLGSHIGVVKTIGLPKYFGCGLAGGDWNEYRKVIETLASIWPEYQFHIIEKKN